MNSSPTLTKISPALLKAQAAMGNAKKDAVNPFFKKSYADINSVREAIIPALNENGISIIQPTCVIDGITYIETVLLHESGEYISSLTPVIVDKVNDAQRHGSGISYARRYALQSIANIGAEDDDANLASGNKQTFAASPKWTPTNKQWVEAESLLNGSTLDNDKKAAALTKLSEAKSQGEWTKIINRLKEVQTPA